MSQLKPSFIQDIREALGRSHFTPEDFELELPKSGRLLVKITFIHKPEYFLAVFEDEKQEQITIEQKYLMSSRTERIRQIAYSVKTVPGRFKIESNTEISDPGNVLDEVPKWCENIRADLYALTPTQDPLEKLRQQLKANLDELVKDPNAYFNEDELSVVDKRFDKLYEDIAQLREQYSLTKQQLAELQKEIEEFKNSARVYPKGIWARITSNKLVKATGQIINSPEGRTFLFQQIRRALGMADEA